MRRNFLLLAWNAYADEVKLVKLDTRLSIFGLRDCVEWSVIFSNHNSRKLMKLGGEGSQARLRCFRGCLRGWIWSWADFGGSSREFESAELKSRPSLSRKLSSFSK
jgi:hypothetical protein